MKIFITSTFEEGNNKGEIEKLCSIVKGSGFEDFCFIRDVENYKKIFQNPKQLMSRAGEEINKCDALLFDATNKSTGRAIEVGIAYSGRKKIIVIMRKGTEIKDTLNGVADAVIIYNTIEDIQGDLNRLHVKWDKQ
mgnify:CR=1 FL=1